VLEIAGPSSETVAQEVERRPAVVAADHHLAVEHGAVSV
jgi:hypothetical protein